VPARRDGKLTASFRLTTAGLIGVSATVAGLLAPTAAYAGATATDAQWDRVAQCESGGNWHINTGNGYYGGLQFSEATWKSYDTANYAARPDLAAREQQIDIANHVLANEGWNAWPTCPPGPAGPAAPSGPSPAAAAPAKGGAHLQPGHRTAGTGEHVYVVRRGDTLYSIARSLDVRGGWKALYDRNRAVIGADPKHLRVGIRLVYVIR
jgi:hypothetical protein